MLFVYLKRGENIFSFEGGILLLGVPVSAGESRMDLSSPSDAEAVFVCHPCSTDLHELLSLFVCFLTIFSFCTGKCQFP